MHEYKIIHLGAFFDIQPSFISSPIYTYEYGCRRSENETGLHVEDEQQCAYKGEL